jgi:hypothetical protein
VTGDAVNWWDGYQFGIVPGACIDAIIATARTVEHVSGPAAVAVFSALTVAAGRDGSGAGQTGAARMLSMSPGAVRRIVATCLEPAGVVTRMDRGLVLHPPSAAAEARQPARSDPGDARHSARPERATRRDDARHSARPPYTESADDPQTLPVAPPQPSAQLALVSPPAGSMTVGFDAFWDVYPSTAGKAGARKAWAKAVRRASPADIIAGAKRYRDDPNREDRYTKHAQGWLNDGRWEDGPLPARGRRTSSGRGGAAAATERQWEATKDFLANDPLAQVDFGLPAVGR